MKQFIELMAFPFYDHSSMETHFTAKAESGWRVDGIGLTIHYHRAEPARVKYAITYVDDSRQWSPPTGSELRFQEFCEEAGWELVAENKKIKVFCNEDPDAVPLETDPLVQVNNISICAVGYKMGWMISFFVCIVLGLINVKQLMASKSLLKRSDTLALCAIWLFAAAINADTLLTYIRWERQARRNAENQIFTPTWSHHKLQLWGLSLFWCAVQVYLFFRSGGGFYGAAWVLIGLLCFGPVFSQTTANFKLRRKGVSGPVNWFLSYGWFAAVLIALIVIFTIMDARIA